ncbi:MAG TPA: O-antigen ligase family protein [Polyangiaceae bacterium]|nr:O-antigen ligase family protein [Polyangiaceae bacterium]
MVTEQKVGGDVIGALTVVGVLTLLGVLVADSSLGLLVTLIDFFLLVYVMFRVPVRQFLMGLMFFVFALPNPSEGQSTKWEPPFTAVGAILLNHLNTVDRSLSFLSSASFSGLDLLLVMLGVVVFIRKQNGSKIDSAGRLETPKPLKTMAFISLGGTIFSWVSGLVRGGDFGMSLWQVNCVVYMPVLFLLFQYGLRGPRDHQALARVIMSAAVYKCFMAYYIVHFIPGPLDPDTGSTRPVYGTSHNDSMLFAAAFVLVLALLVERAGKSAKWYGLIFLPILAMGTIANNRRLAWVQVALVFFTVYLISRESPIKRKLRRTLIALTPLIAVYIYAGWESQYGGTFKAVRMIRSVVDAKSDGSSQWREYENVNLIATFRTSPIIGTGYGVPYQEMVVLPPVDYPLERYLPHNSLLGLWSYTGMVGYAALTLLWAVGVYFGMLAYYKAEDARLRAAALVSFGSVLIYLLQSWGDLGLGSWTGIFMMATALTVAGKAAVAAGQWGDVKAIRAGNNAVSGGAAAYGQTRRP